MKVTSLRVVIAIVDERLLERPTPSLVDARAPHAVAVDVTRFKQGAVVVGPEDDGVQMGAGMINELEEVVIDEPDLRGQRLEEFDTILLSVLMEDVVGVVLREKNGILIGGLQRSVQRVGATFRLVDANDLDPVGILLRHLLDAVYGGGLGAAIVADDEIEVGIRLSGCAIEGDPKPVLASIPDWHEAGYEGGGHDSFTIW